MESIENIFFKNLNVSLVFLGTQIELMSRVVSDEKTKCKHNRDIQLLLTFLAECSENVAEGRIL